MKKNKTTDYKPLIIFLIIVFIFGVSLAVYTYLNREQEIPDGVLGNSSGNMNNYGLFAEADGYIYFSNSYDNSKLYRATLEGTEATCISDVPVQYINAYGNRVYYYQVPGSKSGAFGLDGLYGICKTDIYGKKGLDNLDKAKCESMMMIGDQIYYQKYDDKTSSLTLCKVSTDGKTKEKISDKYVFVSCPHGNELLYFNLKDHGQLSSYNIKTGSIRTFADIRAYKPLVTNNYIYYMNVDDKYKLYRYSLSDNNEEQITDFPIDTFNVFEDQIFVQKNEKGNAALMRLTTSDFTPQLVMAGNYSNINCTSLYTYFYGYGEIAPIYRVRTMGGTSVEPFEPAK